MAQRGLRPAIRVMLAVGVACLAGCGGSSTSTTTTTLTLTSRNVTGVVVNFSTGTVVPSPTLTIGNQTVVGGVDGTFTLANVQRLNQTLTVSASGYQTATLTLLSTQDQLTVSLVPGTTSTTSPPGTVTPST